MSQPTRGIGHSGNGTNLVPRALFPSFRGGVRLQTERVSSAKLRELRITKVFTLKEQSKFSEKELSVRENLRM